MDWFELLAVQRTLKSLLQHHSSKALILGSLQQWEVREVGLGRLVTILLPSGQSRWLEKEGDAEPRD